MLALDIPRERALGALRTAQVQITLRVAQLASCRACGADLAKFERELGTLREMITQLEAQHDDPGPPRPE